MTEFPDIQPLPEPTAPPPVSPEAVVTGAQWLHIVDLEGAKVGKPVNTDAIAAIAALDQFKIEVGGGLRDEVSIRQLLDMGIERAIIGTKAVSDFEWFARCAEKFSSKMSGPNFERTKALVQAVNLPVVASGGVREISDIEKLAELGVRAAIIGRSLYEGILKLSDAIQAASSEILFRASASLPKQSLRGSPATKSLNLPVLLYIV